MSKMVIKNKLKLPKELDKDTPFRYQFIVKPHSYNKKLPLAPIMTTEEFTYNFKTKPLLEFKYRECYFFEKLFSSLCFFNTRDTERLINLRNNYKDFSYRVHQLINTGENRQLILEHDDSVQRFNCNFKQCYYAENSYYLDYIFNTSDNVKVTGKKHDFTLIGNNSYGMNPDNNHTINSMFKYLNDDIINITQTIYDFFVLLCDSIDISIPVYEKIIEGMGLDYSIYSRLYHALKGKNFKLFRKNFLLLVDNSVPVTHDKLNDNIEIELHNNQQLSDVLCIYNVYDALNNTTGRVKVVPNQKKYYNIFLNDVKISLVDSFKIFFEDENDVHNFFEKYYHYTEFNLSTLTSFHEDYLSEKSIAYVNSFIPDDVVVIQDKVKNSSVGLEVSTRKTPYKNDINGFLVLSNVTIEKDKFYNTVDELDGIEDYIHSVSTLLATNGINATLWYNAHTRYFGVNQVTQTISDGIFVADNDLEWCRHIGSSKISTSWRNLIRKEFNDGDHDVVFNHFGLSSAYNNARIYLSILVPISFNDDITGILKLLQKQKLMGKFKNFKINNVLLAPYSTVERNKTDKIIDAIADM